MLLIKIITKSTLSFYILSTKVLKVRFSISTSIHIPSALQGTGRSFDSSLESLTSVPHVLGDGDHLTDQRDVVPDFQHSVAVAVSVKTVSVHAVAAGACARQQRGRPRSQGAEFPAQKGGRSSRRVRTADTEK